MVSSAKRRMNVGETLDIGNGISIAAVENPDAPLAGEEVQYRVRKGNFTVKVFTNFEEADHYAHMLERRTVTGR